MYKFDDQKKKKTKNQANNKANTSQTVRTFKLWFN